MKGNMATKKSEWKPKLIGDYKFDEVASALQKSIRRSLEYDACFWSYIFHFSGFGEYLWRRLSIICSEDVGNGQSQAAILLSSLRESWERIHKRIKYHTTDKFLFVIQAVLFMCRAKKSRENDSLANLIEENWKKGQRLEVSEIVLCPHTQKGREIFGKFGDKTDGKEKLRIKKWFLEWAKINNEAYSDKWQKQLEKIWLENAG